MAERVFAAVRGAVPDAHRLGHPDRRLPHILSMRLPGVVGQTLAMRCDARGVAFSTGSACHGAHGDDGGGKQADNHVLAAIGLDRAAAREVVRVSFSGATTDDEVAFAAEAIADEAQRLLGARPRGAGAAGR
jgi:cysteine desulfurase